MLKIDVLRDPDPRAAASAFHRDGFIVVDEAIDRSVLADVKTLALQIIEERKNPVKKFGRGILRFTFGNDCIRFAEWLKLLESPVILSILEAIWHRSDFSCYGGDYCLPGAPMQPPHADRNDADFLCDPIGSTTEKDLPAPGVCINFPLVNVTEVNGPLRLMPCTQRSKCTIPSPRS